MMGDAFITVGEIAQAWYAAFTHSALFVGIKIFFVIYTTILVVDIILLIYLGDVKKQWRQQQTGSSVRKPSKKKERQIWADIMARVDTNDEDQFKAAILEADQFTYDRMGFQGYNGSTFSERLSQIPPGSFLATDAVRVAHQLSNAIVQKEHVTMTKEQAVNTLKIYERFLSDIDVI